MTGRNALCNRRRNLMMVDPHCYYCGMLLRDDYPPSVKNANPPPRDMATIEHLNSKIRFPDGRPQQQFTRVLSCRPCNQAHAADEQRSRASGKIPAQIT